MPRAMLCVSPYDHARMCSGRLLHILLLNLISFVMGVVEALTSRQNGDTRIAVDKVLGTIAVT